MAETQTKVSGSADAGWLVEVHDGNNFATYSPVADTAQDAEKLALEAHSAAFPVPVGAVSDAANAPFERVLSDLHDMLKSAFDRIAALETKLEGLFQPVPPPPMQEHQQAAANATPAAELSQQAANDVAPAVQPPPA